MKETQLATYSLYNLKIKNIQILTIDGKLIPETSNNNIDFSKLKAETSFVKSVTTNGFGIKKVIVK